MVQSQLGKVSAGHCGPCSSPDGVQRGGGDVWLTPSSVSQMD